MSPTTTKTAAPRKHGDLCHAGLGCVSLIKSKLGFLIRDHADSLPLKNRKIQKGNFCHDNPDTWHRPKNRYHFINNHFCILEAWMLENVPYLTVFINIVAALSQRRPLGESTFLNPDLDLI